MFKYQLVPDEWKEHLKNSLEYPDLKYKKIVKSKKKHNHLRVVLLAFIFFLINEMEQKNKNIEDFFSYFDFNSNFKLCENIKKNILIFIKKLQKKKIKKNILIFTFLTNTYTTIIIKKNLMQDLFIVLTELKNKKNLYNQFREFYLDSNNNISSKRLNQIQIYLKKIYNKLEIKNDNGLITLKNFFKSNINELKFLKTCKFIMSKSYIINLLNLFEEKIKFINS